MKGERLTLEIPVGPYPKCSNCEKGTMLPHMVILEDSEYLYWECDYSECCHSTR